MMFALHPKNNTYFFYILIQNLEIEFNTSELTEDLEINTGLFFWLCFSIAMVEPRVKIKNTITSTFINSLNLIKLQIYVLISI